MSTRTIHPFPAKMAPDIALDRLARETNGAELVVLDPMCGSGTVLGAAASRGYSAIGFDVDPLAVLMSRVATAHVNVDELLVQASKTVHQVTAMHDVPELWIDPETRRFAEYWFAAEQRAHLSKLTHAISSVVSDSIREALQVAMSRIIVTKSPKASLAADASHSRPHRVQLVSDYDIIQGFLRSVGSLAKLLSRRELRATVSVSKGDARALPLEESSVDLVITSPPYLNAIDYLRGHKLSLIWLGYDIPTLRKIRSESIGSERSLPPNVALKAADTVERIKGSVDQPENLPLSIIRRYAHDLTLFADELARVTRPGARVVTVIGNSTLRGNYIRNDQMVQEAYEAAGMTVEERIERDLPENRRYLPVGSLESKSSMAKRMRSEVVLTVFKS